MYIPIVVLNQFLLKFASDNLYQVNDTLQLGQFLQISSQKNISIRVIINTNTID